jgi:glycine/serine hydroxymethyltransferase
MQVSSLGVKYVDGDTTQHQLFVDLERTKKNWIKMIAGL